VKVAISELFMEAMEKGDKPLGKLATDLVCLLTDPEKQFASDGLDLIYCIPILGYYGQLEESYIKAQREIDSYISKEVGQWPLSFRSLPLPQDDSIFYSRNIKREFIVSTAIANRVILEGKFMRSKVPLLLSLPGAVMEIDPSMRPRELR
jgi:hypothetical protein